MPHSSGGGHSSSSYHSSSSSSSRSYSSSSYSSSSSSSSHSSSSYGGGPTYRTSRTWFSGSQRYRYYGWGHKPKYVYSNRTLSKKPKPGCVLIGLYIIVLLIFARLLYVSIAPSKLNTEDKGYKCEIYDYAGVIDDDDMLMESLTNFASKSGVPIVVATVYNAEWEDNYDDLEEFAYYYYVANYEDEDHWIIILSMDNYTSACDFIGMQGDNTNSVITITRRRLFNNTLEEKLPQMRTDKAIAYAFDTISEGLGEYYIRNNYVATTLGLIIIMWLYRGYKWFINPRVYELA